MMNYVKLHIILVILFFAAEVNAQKPTIPMPPPVEVGYLDQHDNWSFELPLWLPGYKGEYKYGDDHIEGGDGTEPKPPIPEHPIEKPDYGDIFSRLFSSSENLKAFWGLRITYTKNRFISQIGFYTGTVSYNVKYNLNNRSLVDADVSSTTGRAFMGYAFYKYTAKSKKNRFIIYGLLGAKYFNLTLKYELEKTRIDLLLKSASLQPITGLRFHYATRKWLFIIHGDYGFSISDKSTSYMVQALIHYRLGQLASLKLGWDHQGIRYNTEIYNEPFTTDIILSGPVFTFQLHF